MSNISKNTESKYRLNGITSNAPIDWSDVTIEAEYENDSVQPNLTISEFNFNLESRKAINEWIANGTTSGVGIFEGMPFELDIFNNNGVAKTFKAFIDFTESYNDLTDDGEVLVSIMKDGDIENFFDKLNGTTCGYLEEIGVFTSADYINVPYVVEKKFNLFEILLTSIVLYLMVKELAESIRNTSESIATASGIFSAGFTGSVGSAIYLALIAIVNIIYTAILVLAIIELAKSLFNTLISPLRTHKAILLKTALTKIANHFGYDFVCPVEEYNNLVYLPSNPNLDEKTLFGFVSVTKGTPSGIPNNLDYGYFTEDLFNLAKRIPYAKMQLIGNTIHLRPENDPFWEMQSTWVMPDIKLNTLQYNTEDLQSTRLMSFQVDLNDEWTIDNYDRTAVEIKTDPISVINERAVLLKGLEEVDYNTALGNRKDSLNAVEKLLKTVGAFIDEGTSLLGSSSNFSGLIQNKIGSLKQTSNWHSLPKLLYMTGGVIPANHRDLFNAEVLWDKYHVEKSFVQNNWRGQKYIYRGIDIPFGVEDFLKLTDNSFFTFEGKQAKIIKFVWTTGEDTAKIDFWVREPYTFNLKETKIIPS